ncbi:hypothetical protein VKT23_008817 [Stygiomarasmius scandens]|uniref:Uncharacterized protein n=1 Tax=Marasmiellus scandens TaxID=2682957 RepID=A0ABR1JI80_9AGAR
MALSHQHWLEDWHEVDNPYLENFRTTWWGNGQRSNFATGTWITVPEKVCETLQSSLINMDGQLYLRKENSETYGRLHDPELPRFAKGGVLLLGHSGTGISTLLLYFLIKRLSEAQPTLFITKDNSAFFFASDGVWKPPSLPLLSEHCPPHFEPLDARIWSLVDSENPPSAAVFFSWWVVRAGHVATSTTPMLDDWCMRHNGRIWYMPRWKKADLDEIVGKHPEAKPFSGYPVVLSTIFDYATPNPSEVLDFILHPHHLDQRRKELALSDEDMFQRLRANCRLKPHPKISLVAIRDASHTRLRSDQHILDFTCPAIQAMVTKELKLLCFDQTLSLSNRVTMPGVSSLDSWVFRSFVASVLKDGEYRRFIEGFFRMSWELEGNFFVHEGGGEGQIEVGLPSCMEQHKQMKGHKRHASHEHTIWKRIKSDTDNNCQSTDLEPEPLPAPPCHVQIFQTLEDIQFSLETFFVPSQSDPLFTFFFFELKQQSLITIWFLKTPEPATLDTKRVSIVPDVTNLVLKQNPGCTVNLRYVLVVPAKKRRIVWHMSSPKARDNVFVQEVEYTKFMYLYSNNL